MHLTKEKYSEMKLVLLSLARFIISEEIKSNQVQDSLNRSSKNTNIVLYFHIIILLF